VGRACDHRPRQGGVLRDCPARRRARLVRQHRDHELYWLTAGGVAVKLTNGASLNLSLIGGIAGDYAAVGAEVAYDDANDRYTFKQQGAPKTWARMASGDVRIYETGTNENVYVGLKAPAALAASYDVTWPVALPARTSVLTVTPAGIVAFDESTRSMQVPGILANDITNTHTRIATGYLMAASVAVIYFPIHLAVGDQLIGFSVLCDKETNAADTITARAAKFAYTDVAETLLGAGVNNAANAPGKVALTEVLGAPETIAADTQYYVKFTPGGATAALHRVFHLEVKYKRS
jgi:hypothetical protein